MSKISIRTVYPGAVLGSAETWNSFVLSTEDNIKVGVILHCRKFGCDIQAILLFYASQYSSHCFHQPYLPVLLFQQERELMANRNTGLLIDRLQVIQNMVEWNCLMCLRILKNPAHGEPQVGCQVSAKIQSARYVHFCITTFIHFVCFLNIIGIWVQLQKWNSSRFGGGH